MTTDIINKIYGDWIVLKDLGLDKSHHRHVLARCKCGSEKNVLLTNLVTHQSVRCKSCSKSRHRGRYKPEYLVWCNMKRRCFDPRNEQYKNYGGRGITVCARWLHSFENFYEDMGPRPSKIHSIDRINNNGNYEPGNCRWATPTEQANNRR